MTMKPIVDLTSFPLRIFRFGGKFKSSDHLKLQATLTYVYRLCPTCLMEYLDRLRQPPLDHHHEPRLIFLH